MKKLSILLFASALMAAACKKSHAPASIPSDDHGCIEQVVTDRNSPGLSPANLKSADSLMDVNHIDHSHIRYFLYRTDTFRAGPSSLGVFEQIVLAHQYINGLRLFNSPMQYLFSDGTLHDTAGTPIAGISLDTKSTLTLVQLRSLFTRDILKIGGINLQHFTDSCYTAEFGYFNLSAGDPRPPQLVKAWFVSFRSYDYPGNILSAYYQDSDGKLLGFPGAPISID